MTFVDANLKIHAPQASSRLVKHWAQRICSWGSESDIDESVAIQAFHADGGVSEKHHESNEPHVAGQGGMVSWLFGAFLWVANLCRLLRDDCSQTLLSFTSSWLRKCAKPRRRKLSKPLRGLIRTLCTSEVVAQQDKCPAAAVGMPRAAYNKLLHETFFCDPVHYKTYNALPEHIVEHQYFQHIAACPKWSRRRRSAWTPQILLQVYINIKRTCFGANGCCCSKSHAHVREIISNCRSPLRRAWRLLNRAVQCVVKASGRRHGSSGH